MSDSLRSALKTLAGSRRLVYPERSRRELATLLRDNSKSDAAKNEKE